MYKIANNNGEIELLFYDFIDDYGITAQSVVSELASARSDIKELTLRINSRGGDLGEALGLYNYIRSLNVPKTAYIDGVAMSAATIIAMSADKIIMPEDAVMMIHNPWTFCEGEADELRTIADSLEKWRDICVNIYVKKTGLSREEIIAMMDKQTEMTGKEAFEKGFIDEVSGEAHNEINDAYTKGVMAERKRIHELDELMNADRKEIIMKAKYETFRNAKDIAVELLKKETSMSDRMKERRYDASDCDDVSIDFPFRNEIAEGVKALNRMRGHEGMSEGMLYV